MRLFQPALAALLAALAFGRVASAFPVVLNVDAATDGLASPTQALLAGGVIEVGWLAPGTTNAQIQALAAAADFAGIDAVFNQLVTIPFPSADVDFDSLGGQYFESVTVVPDGDSAGLAAYQNATTGAAGKPMYSWVRNSVSLSGTTQMAFVDGVGVFPPAIDPLGSDFAETFAHSDPPAGTVVLFGTVVSVTVGGAIDNSGVGNTPGDGLGANGSNKVLLLATVVVATEASMQFSAGTATVIENAGSVTVTVTRTGRLDNAVSVQFSTANASALAGTDYTSTSGTLNFMANDTSETIVVPIANPAGFQGDRSFAIGLSNPLPGAAAVLGSPVGGGRAAWIGLELKTKGGKDWRWSTGEAVTAASWNTGEPNNFDKNEACGEWLVVDGRWNDTRCALEQPYLCQQSKADQPLACKGGRTFAAGGVSYCLNGVDRNYADAKRACAADGGGLAVLKTTEGNHAVRDAMAARFAATRMWIGLSDTAEEGNWSWTSGSGLEYAAWAPDEPNNYNEEHCVELHADAWKWNDLECSTKLPSVCESPGKRR